MGSATVLLRGQPAQLVEHLLLGHGRREVERAEAAHAARARRRR